MKNFVKLKEGERIDDLQIGGLGLIQHPHEYCFTSDAVLLANFVKIRKGDTIADFGAGSGIISILIAEKQNPKQVFAVELQPHLADMAMRSVIMNGLENVIEVVNKPMQQFAQELPKPLDAVVCNPPYRKADSGEAQVKQSLRLCRHEEAVTLDEVAESASKALKFGGKLFLVHQAERMAEVFEVFCRYSIEPKVLQTVCQRTEAAPNLILVCGVKNGKKGLAWKSPLVMFDEQGNFTADIRKIYGEQ